MADYRAPIRDITFVLDHLADLEALCEFDAFGEIDRDTVVGVIEESGRFFEDVVAPLYRPADASGGSRWNPDGTVTTPDGYRDAYRQYVEAGWGAVPFPQEYGGGGFPWISTIAMQEVLTSADMSFSMGPLLTQGAIALGGAGCTAAFMVISLSANVLSQIAVMWYVAAFVGTAAAIGGPRDAQDEARLSERPQVATGA